MSTQKVSVFSESAFDLLAEGTLLQIEHVLERLCVETDWEIECIRQQNVLEIEIENSVREVSVRGSKIIIHSHATSQEIWLAAKTGAFHFKYDAGHWRSTREGVELMQCLSQHLSMACGQEINLPKLT